jgi:glutaredoxin
MGFLMMTKPGCNRSAQAKALLRSRGQPVAVNLHDTPEKVDRFKANGYKDFPQIFHNGVLVGGLSDLVDYLD